MNKLLMLAVVLVAATAHGEIYTWTDARGTRHYTNSLYEVPTRYREKVKVLDLGTVEQKAGQAAPQQGVPGSPPPQVATPPPSTTVRQEEPNPKRGVRNPERASRRSRGPRVPEE